MNSLRIGDFFVAKALRRWVAALWRILYFRSGMTNRSGRIFHNRVTTSVGLLSSGDPRVHFGSETESKVAPIEVRWPSGIAQALTDVAAGQVLKIEGPTK